jgi:hypothetical protein
MRRFVAGAPARLSSTFKRGLAVNEGFAASPRSAAPFHNPNPAPFRIGRQHRGEDVGSSGLKVLRRYCPRCGSPLTTEPDLTPDVMFVKAGGINSNEWFHPVLELIVERRRPWVSPVTGATQFEGNPIL